MSSTPKTSKPKNISKIPALVNLDTLLRVTILNEHMIKPIIICVKKERTPVKIAISGSSTVPRRMISLFSLFHFANCFPKTKAPISEKIQKAKSTPKKL
jgi:hypothetical protein